jgi:hypothetical protein
MGMNNFTGFSARPPQSNELSGQKWQGELL